jgi:hypothetical protein
MFVGSLVTFALDLFLLRWIAELTWKRKRFTQSTKYDLTSFGEVSGTNRPPSEMPDLLAPPIVTRPAQNSNGDQAAQRMIRISWLRSDEVRDG